ncbi:Serine/Threonine kinase domain protein (macronuclear) [Tetrahymena thermophila SB210]|uniref:non-specific serine/threonine protein kinase n=1 Tax=Tetrahymena thermophila (strain SB210) TaxID=312017 RepID=Q22KP3_TETTS|nr:Serine/Threonine kinase domain protein [Tetrahymena thermophila SB210]EAR85756.2 Serine/Threonine kinase domain protein [Tetrahymena thermophila SB210]|eukprot:XP_001033419.2 Serine/Threonine kinase domain protein [Tetrahymena thermophila SB210]
MAQKEYKKLYKEIEVIGRGNFGSATLVEKLDNKKQYIAKKIVLSSLNPKQQDSALQEAQLLKDLNHKNIVSYIESFKEEDLLIIIMEYCEHGDLAFHIKRKKQKKEYFPEMLIVNWFYELALSIKYIHEKKILHRDIKTSNIFITRDGTIKIGDFGISKVLENTTSVANTVVGTPYYMSPEVCESKPYTYKSDIWALGCVLYELCALEHAFESNNLLGLIFKIVQQNISDIPSFYSKELNDLIHKLLNKNEQERPVINDILNDISTQKLFKQYLEVRVDPSQVKQDQQISHSKRSSNNHHHHQGLSNVNDGKGNSTNKENNAQNQFIITDKTNIPKTNMQDGTTSIQTVDSQIYQINNQQLQNAQNQHHHEHKEEPEYKIKAKIIKRNVYTPDTLTKNNSERPSSQISNSNTHAHLKQVGNSNNTSNNVSNNVNSNANTNYTSNNNIAISNNTNNNDFKDGTHDEYYHDEDLNTFKSQRNKFDESTAIKHNNFIKQDSPVTLQKVKSQSTFNHQSKFKKEDGSKQFDMFSSSRNAPHQQAASQPHNIMVNSQGNQRNQQYQNICQQIASHEQTYNQPSFVKQTPKQLAQRKKEEKTRLQQEQLTEYTKSQIKNSMISRERYIQNVYGEKFLSNQSVLKQYEESIHKQQKNLHLEPIQLNNMNNAKQLLKNNFMSDRNSSPINRHQQTNFMMVETQFQQDIPIPSINGHNQRSPNSYKQQIDNVNIYSEIDYPIETSEKFAVSTQINRRRNNNGSKSDVASLIQEDDQQKGTYNMIHRNVPSYKNQFAFLNGGVQKTFKFHTQQDELAESEVLDQQNVQNKFNLNKQKAKIQQMQQDQSTHAHQQGGVSYSNTQFESDLNLDQIKNNETIYQDIPLPNVKKTDSEALSSPHQNSFESYFSKEEITDQVQENSKQSQNNKGLQYKIKTKQLQSTFKHAKQQRQETQEDEYDQEQFEDYFSDEDAEMKKQLKQAQNSNSNNNNSNNNKEQNRKSSNYSNSSNNNNNNNKNNHLESIAENDCEQTQFTPLQSMIGHQQVLNFQQSVRKQSNGKSQVTNQDSLKQSKNLQRQNSSNSNDDLPPQRLSNNQSRNSPKNANDNSFKNNSNPQMNLNQSKLISLRKKCQQSLGDHFDKVYDIIQKSNQQNIKDQKMLQMLVDIVGKSKINDCFEVEQLIFIEEEMRKK